MMLKKINMLLMKMMAMMTPSCDVITRRISESYDRKLAFRERLSIRIHTLGCVLCERYRRQLMALHRMLQKYSGEIDALAEDVALPQETKERLKKKLHESS